MILLDTNIWLQYFRGSDDVAAVRDLVRRGEIAVHEYIIGELLLGGLSTTNEKLLHSLQFATTVDSARVQTIIKERDWRRFAIGWVDACLAASALESEIRLATRDNALVACCREAGCLDRM